MIRFNEGERVPDKEKPRPKSPQHEKFPMGKVDDVHDTKDQAQSRGDQDKDQGTGHTVYKGLDEHVHFIKISHLTVCRKNRFQIGTTRI